MHDLHPEVEKDIVVGPLWKLRNGELRSFPELTEDEQETPEEFARRIAALAVQLEREECASIASAHMSSECPSSTGEYGLGYSDAAEHIHAAIVRRGKP